MSTFYLVDGHAQFFRAYHAIRPGLRSPITNEPTNMTFGFVGMLLKLLRERRPDYLAVVVDASGDQGTFRSQIYPEYKANRSAPPEDLEPQVERCIALLRQLQIPVLAVEGVEADDTIATVVRRVRSEHPDVEIRIVSRDKDLGQLLDDQVRLFDPQTDSELGVEELFANKGIRPDQVVDMLALMGDPVDNVPGVKGIGPKTAAKLIGQYGSLQGLLDNVDKVPGKTGQAIAAQKSLLPLSLSLVRLRDEVPLDFALEQAKVDMSRVPPGPPLETVRQLGFGRHLTELRGLLGGEGSGGNAPGRLAETLGGSRAGPQDEPPSAREVQRAETVAQAMAAAVQERATRGGAPGGAAGGSSGGSGTTRGKGVPPPEEFNLFNQAPEVPAGAVQLPTPTGEAMRRFAEGDYRLLRTREEVEAFVRKVRASCANPASDQGGVLAFDTETTGLNPVSAALCGVSMSIHPGTGVYVPLRSPEPESHLPPDEALEWLRPLFADPAIPKVAHNAKFDLVVLRGAGVPVRGLVGDSMIASYVLDATRGTHKLDALSEAFLGHQCIPITELIGTGKHQRTFDHIPLELAGPYAAEDADVALQLERLLVPKVDQEGLGSLYRDVEVPLVEVLAELEWNGIRVDPEELERQRRALESEITRLRERIAALAPRPFNPDSPKQLAEILFNGPGDTPPGLGIKVVKKTRTGASTDMEVLEKLAADPGVSSEIPSLILEYRQLTKLVGTYLVALRQAINPVTGRVHASFHQTVAATGRLSSSDPNLQNIPIRTATGREIRRAFVADPGNLIYSADYSQIELRMLAHLSGDPGLSVAFQAGADIHTAVAAEVYGVPQDEVTSEQRSAAKMVNFGIVYGITPYGLARRLGGNVSNERARQIIEGYKARFAHIDAFLAKCVQQAREQGYVQTILGRRRATPQVHSRNPAERAFGERIAINTVVQGSAADLIKLAMLRIHRSLAGAVPGARMLLQIHDELVFEVPAGQVERLDTFVRAEMENAMPLSVPLKAQSGWADNWFDA